MMGAVLPRAIELVEEGEDEGIHIRAGEDEGGHVWVAMEKEVQQ